VLRNINQEVSSDRRKPDQGSDAGLIGKHAEKDREELAEGAEAGLQKSPGKKPAI